MDKYRIIEVKQSIFENNDREAEELRSELKAQGTYLINLMASPGAGKTSVLKRILDAMKDEMKIGVAGVVDDEVGRNCLGIAVTVFYGRE